MAQGELILKSVVPPEFGRTRPHSRFGNGENPLRLTDPSGQSLEATFFHSRHGLAPDRPLSASRKHGILLFRTAFDLCIIARNTPNVKYANQFSTKHTLKCVTLSSASRSPGEFYHFTNKNLRYTSKTPMYLKLFNKTSLNSLI